VALPGKRRSVAYRSSAQADCTARYRNIPEGLLQRRPQLFHRSFTPSVDLDLPRFMRLPCFPVTIELDC